MGLLKYTLQRALPQQLYKALSKTRLPSNTVDFVKFLVAKYAVKNGGDVVDGGAHVGLYSRYFAEFIRGKEGNLLSFEPNPYIYPMLSKTRMLPQDKHYTFQMALSDEKGEASFSVKPYSFEQDSSLEGPAFGKRIEVETIRLDDLASLVSNLRLIKLDVEGHEAAVVRGGEGIIHKTKPVIISEYRRFDGDGDTVLELLDTMGYTTYDCATCMKVEKRPYISELTDLVSFADPKEGDEVMKSIALVCVEE